MTDDSATPVASAEGARRAPLGGRWKFKMGIFLVILFAFGAWGLYDATVVYPARGEKYASFSELQYLLAAASADREEPAIFSRQASVPDPRAELARLSEPETLERDTTDAGSETSRRHLRAQMMVARRTWLESLQVIGQLKPERTTIERPTERLRELTTTWQTTTAPKRLAWFDLPSQWLITAIGFGGGVALLLHVLRVAARKYVWHPGEMRLEVPGGHSFTPEQLEEVDKRKWDKFIVFLRSRDDHPTLKGSEVKIDTYQHAEVEDWVLAMEREAFGDQEEDGAPDESAGAEAKAAG